MAGGKRIPIELEMGKLCKEILHRELELLKREPVFEAKHVAAFEKYVKLVLALKDDFRRDLESDVPKKMLELMNGRQDKEKKSSISMVPGDLKTGDDK